MIRIISGKLKGKRILAPKNFEVRPTTDFAKEALFNILENQYLFSEISVLNLFSGIGSLDYEFASRGCKDITSVDINEKHVNFIKDTIKNLDISKQVYVIKQNVFTFLEKSTYKKYNLIVADPPFDFEKKEYEQLINLIFSKKLLGPDGRFILEHNTRISFSESREFYQLRKYGNVAFSFFMEKQEDFVR